MTQGMEAFAKQYRIAMDDPDLYDLYELKLSADRDNAARMEYALRKAREDAERKKSEEFALRLLKKGMDLEEAAEMTDLSIEHIQSLPITQN